jgi:hypothetical protein
VLKRIRMPSFARSVSRLALVGLVCGLCAVAATAAPAATLSLPDLVNRPDRWPTTVILQREFKFTNGTVFHQGDKVRVVRFDGSRVLVAAPGNQLLATTPVDCGLLDAANQAWAALTPEQRAVDPGSLALAPSLWPLRVVTTVSITDTYLTK